MEEATASARFRSPTRPAAAEIESDLTSLACGSLRAAAPLAGFARDVPRSAVLPSARRAMRALRRRSVGPARGQGRCDHRRRERHGPRYGAALPFRGRARRGRRLERRRRQGVPRVGRGSGPQIRASLRAHRRRRGSRRRGHDRHGGFRVRPRRHRVQPAGIGGAFGAVTDLRVEDWDFTFAVLVRGVFLGTKHGARAMRARAMAARSSTPLRSRGSRAARARSATARARPRS